ncbi:2-keto-4-carboxy-3-hexenedioate hydratase [subsurface metagenome]
MKIDVYAHICPQKFIDAFAKQAVSWETVAKTSPVFGRPALWDINKRLEVMDRYEDYVQLLVPSGQVVEPFFSPKDTAYLAQIFNDAMAELINKYPDKFVGAVATLPLNNIDAALKEIDRVINELGFKGILIHTPIFIYEEGRPIELGYNYGTMKPIDSPELMPIYESMSQHNLPIWIHPVGQGGVPVYSGEERGKYALSHVFGWPLESAVAMGRLVCSGILTKYPNLRFIVHHCGSGIVPALAGRIDNEFDKFRFAGLLKWDRPGEEDPFRTKRAVDYFRMFYADTALYGGVSGLMCGHDFFGAEHIVFGTDFPYDSASGDKFIKKTIDAIYRMTVSDADKKRIFEDNAKRILHLDIQ